MNPLVPLQLKSMLREIADDGEDNGANDADVSGDHSRRSSTSALHPDDPRRDSITGGLRVETNSTPGPPDDKSAPSLIEDAAAEAVKQLNSAFAAPEIQDEDEEIDEGLIYEERLTLKGKGRPNGDAGGKGRAASSDYTSGGNSRGASRDFNDGGEARPAAARDRSAASSREFDGGNSRTPSKDFRPSHDSLGNARSASGDYGPSNSSSSTSSTLLSTSNAVLCIELVYSTQVSCTHRFITFQTRTSELLVRSMIESYLQSKHGTLDVVLDQLMVTPANTVARTSRTGAEIFSPKSAARHSHIYTYDSVGPPRYTLMLILSSVSQDEDLWPEWASAFWSALVETCKDVSAAGGLQQSTHHLPNAQDPHRPCFRELRPASAQQKS
jgi:hypothetical protein